MNLNYSNHQGKNILFMNAKNPGKSHYGSIFCSKAPFRPFKGAPSQQSRGTKQGARGQQCQLPLTLRHFTGLLCQPEVRWEFQGERGYSLKFKICYTLKKIFLPVLSDLLVLKLENILFFVRWDFISCNIQKSQSGGRGHYQMSTLSVKKS